MQDHGAVVRGKVAQLGVELGFIPVGLVHGGPGGCPDTGAQEHLQNGKAFSMLRRKLSVFCESTKKLPMASSLRVCCPWIRGLRAAVLYSRAS